MDAATAKRVAGHEKRLARGDETASKRAGNGGGGGGMHYWLPRWLRSSTLRPGPVYVTDTPDWRGIRGLVICHMSKVLHASDDSDDYKYDTAFGNSSSSSYDQALGNFSHAGDYAYGDGSAGFDDTLWSDEDESLWDRFGTWFRPEVLLAFVVFVCLVQAIHYRLPDIKACWRRRAAAAKYKRIKQGPEGAELAAADEEDLGVLEVLTASLAGDETVGVEVDLGDGTVRKCNAYISHIEKISELPFILNDACKHSSDGELQALSLVDLYLASRLKLQYVAASGSTMDVGKFGTTTPAMLLGARSFKVFVLPQTTR